MLGPSSQQGCRKALAYYVALVFVFSLALGRGAAGGFSSGAGVPQAGLQIGGAEHQAALTSRTCSTEPVFIRRLAAHAQARGAHVPHCKCLRLGSVLLPACL